MQIFAASTLVVLLGTGNPAADSGSFGPGDGDRGERHRISRRLRARRDSARQARRHRDEKIAALQPTNLRVAFVTHLHSDHTVGYADLIFSPWTLGRRVPLDVYGPRASRR